jgi:hypothetical protein
VSFIFCVHYSYPEVFFSLVHSQSDFYNFPVCLLVSGDFEVVWAFIFSFARVLHVIVETKHGVIVEAIGSGLPVL